MKSKGFTLVEVAIVIVIVGMLIGIVIKGRHLVKSAQIKSEVSRLRNLKTVIYTFMTVTNGMPPAKGGQGFTPNAKAFVDMNKLIDYGYITVKDIYSPLSNANWSLTQCLAGENSAGGYLYTNFQGEVVSGNLCAFISGGMVLSLVCNIEINLDDRNIKSGLGRRFGAAWTTPDIILSQMIVDGCSHVHDSLKHNYGYIVY